MKPSLNPPERTSRAPAVFFLALLFVLHSAVISEEPSREYTVGGHSMVPTLLPGTRIKVDAGYYENHPIERGDLVALKLNTQLMVKRVIAIEGDKVVIRDSRLWLNGAILDEPYLETPRKLSAKAARLLSLQLERYGQRIPTAHLIALGDNANSSLDSGDFGFVAYEQVKGKVVTAIAK